jgi:CRP-like cAMP-binding protein
MTQVIIICFSYLQFWTAKSSHWHQAMSQIYHQMPKSFPDQINRDILYAWGAATSRFEKGEVIFTEGELAKYYYQLETGTVRMYNIGSDGKEYTQGMFYTGQSFGEPPLFIDAVYPAAAVACEQCVLLRVNKGTLLNILEEYPDMQRSMLQLLAARAYNKALSARDLVTNNPEQRLLNFLQQLRQQSGNPPGLLLVPFTRQELANFTGMRVETVIRTLRKMVEEKKVTIRDRKLYC